MVVPGIKPIKHDLIDVPGIGLGDTSRSSWKIDQAGEISPWGRIRSFLVTQINERELRFKLIVDVAAIQAGVSVLRFLPPNLCFQSSP
jgi:hypothetical protein